MDLFIVNRYLSNTPAVDKQDEERNLAQLLSKIEERKKRKLVLTNDEEAENSSLKQQRDLQEITGDHSTVCQDSVQSAKKRKTSKPEDSVEGSINCIVGESSTITSASSELQDIKTPKKKKRKKTKESCSSESDIGVTKADPLPGNISDAKVSARKAKKAKNSLGDTNNHVWANTSETDVSSKKTKTGKQSSKDTNNVEYVGAKNGSPNTSAKKKIQQRKSLNDTKNDDSSDTANSSVTETGNNSLNVSENVEFVWADDESDTENISAQSTKPDSGSLNETKNIEGFTVIGVHNFQKKSQVKAVLPSWLAKPVMINVSLQNTKTTVKDIPELHEKLASVLVQNNVTHFFPVQTEVIPWLIKAHQKPSYYWPRDVCVSAPTGSGKTLAFVLPVVQTLMNRVVRHVRALVILPSQNLAVQVYEEFKKYCLPVDLQVALITGSLPFDKEQNQLVRKNILGRWESMIDILVATPGKLVDHLQFTDGFSLKNLQFLIIDEADIMIDDIKNDWLYFLGKHISGSLRPPPLSVATLEEHPRPPQKLLFSATLSQDPEKLQRLGLFQPKLFTSVVDESVSNEASQCEVVGNFIGKYTTPAELTETICVVTTETKPIVLFHWLVTNNWNHVLCFTNNQESTHRLALLLQHIGRNKMNVAQFSAAMKLSQKKDILNGFSKGRINVLVSTDALARGMDIQGVDYVISYDLPSYIKTYIHRVGRTGRAGRLGTALSLVTEKEYATLQKMLQNAGKKPPEEVTVMESDLEYLEEDFTSALNHLKTDLNKEQAQKLRNFKADKKRSLGGMSFTPKRNRRSGTSAQQEIITNG